MMPFWKLARSIAFHLPSRSLSTPSRENEAKGGLCASQNEWMCICFGRRVCKYIIVIGAISGRSGLRCASSPEIGLVVNGCPSSQLSVPAILKAVLLLSTPEAPLINSQREVRLPGSLDLGLPQKDPHRHSHGPSLQDICLAFPRCLSKSSRIHRKIFI